MIGGCKVLYVLQAESFVEEDGAGVVSLKRQKLQITLVANSAASNNMTPRGK